MYVISYSVQNAHFIIFCSLYIVIFIHNIIVYLFNS